MNAPLEAELVTEMLGSVWICYAPLIDKRRKTSGACVTMLSASPHERPQIGALLTEMNSVWPDSSVPVLVAPLDAEFDESALQWSAPRNALLEIPANALLDPRTQSICQALFRDGKRLVLRGRPDVPLPPALLSCFEYAIIHVADDRRRVGQDAPSGVVRRIPF